MSLKRILTIVLYAIIAIVSLIGFYIMLFQSTELGKDASIMLQDEKIQSGTGIVLWLSIILLAVTLLIAFIVSPATNLISNPSSLKGSLLGIGALLVMFLIGYAMAGNEVTPMYEKMGIDSAGKSKFIGGMLNTTYIIFGLSILLYLYNSVTSFIKQL